MHVCFLIRERNRGCGFGEWGHREGWGGVGVWGEANHSQNSVYEKKFYFNKNKKEDTETKDLAHQVKALGTKADDVSLIPRSYNVEENRFLPTICFLTHGACTHAHMRTHTCNRQTNKQINIMKKNKTSYGHMVHKKFIMRRTQKFRELEECMDVLIAKKGVG